MSDVLEPYMSNSNPTLEHHGILGMHWGHRKDETSSVSKSKKKKKVSAREEAKNRAEKMSDEDLNKAVRRLQQETQYIKLTEEKSGKKSTSKQLKDTSSNAKSIKSLAEAVVGIVAIGAPIVKAIRNKNGGKVLHNAFSEAQKAAGGI